MFQSRDREGADALRLVTRTWRRHSCRRLARTEPRLQGAVAGRSRACRSRDCNVMYSVATPVTSSAAFFFRQLSLVSEELPPRSRPPAQRLTPNSLASRLYRGTGNKSRPVFASLRRKVERYSSECLTKAGRCFGSALRDVSSPDQLDKYDGAAASAPLHRASILSFDRRSERRMFISLDPRRISPA